MENKTYDQLWWDEEFVQKRIEEQQIYIMGVDIRWYRSSITNQQHVDLRESGCDVLLRFKAQLKEIQKLKGHCCRY